MTHIASIAIAPLLFALSLIAYDIRKGVIEDQAERDRCISGRIRRIVQG